MTGQISQKTALFQVYTAYENVENQRKRINLRGRHKETLHMLFLYVPNLFVMEQSVVRR